MRLSTSITQPIVSCGCTQSQLASHLSPLLVKLMAFFLSHVSVVIMTVHLIAKPLLDDFSALIVEHPLMTSLLQPGGLIIIHLLSLNDFISVADGPCHLILVFFLDRPSILVEFGRTDECLLHKVTFSVTSTQ